MWPLQLGTGIASPSTKAFLTSQSCGTLVRRLKAFLEWVAREEIDLRTVTYSQLLEWQAALLKGDASQSGRPLQPSTINLYVREACYFLTWLSCVPRDDRGKPWHGPFLVKTTLQRPVRGRRRTPYGVVTTMARASTGWHHRHPGRFACLRSRRWRTGCQHVA